MVLVYSIALTQLGAMRTLMSTDSVEVTTQVRGVRLYTHQNHHFGMHCGAESDNYYGLP